MALTADDFLDKVKLRIGYDPSPKLTSADLLSIADDALSGDMWPMLIKQHGDYYRHTRDYAITADQRRYRLPMKAFGPIADVLYVDDQGNEFSVDAMDPEDVGHQANRYWPPVDSITPGPHVFDHYIEGDYLYLYPKPSATAGTLRVKYFRRPSKLCLEASSRQVTAIEFQVSIGALDVYRLRLNSTTLPANWQDYIDGTGGDFGDGTQLTVDLIGAGNAHQVLLQDVVIADTDTDNTYFADQVVFDFASTDSPEQLASEAERMAAQPGADVRAIGSEVERNLLAAPQGLIGYLALAGQSPIVQCPDALVPLLVARTAQDALDAIGDETGFQRAMERTQRLEAAAVPERSKAEPQYTAVRNSPFRMR